MFSHKQAESFPGRSFYKGKGVDWPRFLLWLLAAFVVAAILAEGMAQLFRLGQYYVFIVPLVAAACVGGMINLAVSRGHCRSPLVGGVAGFCAGALLYLGYFYFGMIHDFGAEMVKHPDSLPSYIRYRMAIEVTRDIHEPERDDSRKPSPGNSYANWGRFAFELILVVAITAGFALKRARKPYCEGCRRWMIRELTQFDPAHSAELVEALRVQSARQLAALSATAPFATIPNFTLAADFCPSIKEGMSRGCPVYLSAKHINMAPRNMAFDSFEQSKGKMLVKMMQLNGDELAALAPRFKAFETVTGRSAVSALLPVEEQDEAVGDKNITYAEITPVPSDHAGKVMTRKTLVIASLFSFGVLGGFFGGMGLLLWGLLTAFPDHPPLEGVSPEAKGFGITLMIAGIALFCVSLAIAFIDSSVMGNRYVRKVLRRELERRTSTLVDVNDPDALFAECVPKLNWGKMMLDNASDVGLLVVDRQKREVRFEGDTERWRIPAASITYGEFEVFVRRQGHAVTRIFYVVLRVNHRGGFWEAPIRPRGSLGLFSGKRKKATRQLFEAIESIRGVRKDTLASV